MNKRGMIVILEISNLILAIIAFSFMIWNVGVVSGQQEKSAKDGTPSDPLPLHNVHKVTIISAESAPQTPAEPGPPAKKEPPFVDLGSVPLNAVVNSFLFASMITGAVAMAAGLFGMKSEQIQALSAATFAGVFVGKGLYEMNWVSGLEGAGIGLGVSLIVFTLTYKKTSKKTVTFECKPYQPPAGGQYCELCNKDPFRPCSEYRCKSLGQACQLLNAGTGRETCAWVNKNDVTSPTISPWSDILTKEHEYKDIKTRPPGTGMRIIRTEASDGCIKAFTPLTFGITTNEPTQCKIDYNSTTTLGGKKGFEAIKYYFGESSLYAYNHSQTLRLPGPTALNETGGVEILHDGTFTLFVRCHDANGNVNEDEFAIRFCVEKGPDTTPPKIEGTSIANNMPIRYNVPDIKIEVYVNEPADCKWGRQDKDYNLMENEMECDSNVWDINTNMLYKCSTKLTGLENKKDNEYYFRCRDQPNANLADRNTNQESYKYILKGTEPLNILRVSPSNTTIRGFSDVVGIELEVETANGYSKGDSICYFDSASIGENCAMKKDKDYVKMFGTGTNKHKQRQDLTGGEYTYCFKCVDLGGNVDFNSASFEIEIDRLSPVVIRVYNEGGNLKIVTDEPSTCSYSQASNLKCNFELDKGIPMIYANATEHYTEWKPNTFYYIKCVDTSGNQPNPTACSMIVKPFNVKGE